MISNESRGRAKDGRLGVLRPVGLIAALAGAVGSMGFMLHASQHPPRILLVLFVIWVLAPGRQLSKRISQRACSGGGEFLGEFLPTEYGMNVGKVRRRRSVSLGSTADYR